jgi:hypothetical protein
MRRALACVGALRRRQNTKNDAAGASGVSSLLLEEALHLSDERMTSR